MSPGQGTESNIEYPFVVLAMGGIRREGGIFRIGGAKIMLLHESLLVLKMLDQFTH